MWRLFPPSWFNRRNPAERAQADAVDLLHEHWRDRLVEGLRRVLEEELPPDTALQRLRSLSGSELLALDVALRIRQWTNNSMPKGRRRVSLTEISNDREGAAAYLFVAACDSSGFVRERALDALRHYPGQLAVSAALIRCDDWVSEVRSAARNLLDALLAQRGAEALVDQLELLVRLRARQRFGEAAWYTAIDLVLHSPEVVGRLWRWAREGPWDVRKYALELIASAGPDACKEAALHALRDSDLRIALWGLHRLSAEGGIADGEMLRGVARHPAAPVRAAVIRLALQVDEKQARVLVERGLFDLARQPRAAAAYVLESRFAQSPLEIWRTTLAGPEGRRRRSALLGLCDRATPEDASQLATEARHPSALVRAAVLQGLWRARANILGAQLERALIDPSPMVVRRAIEVYARSTEPLSPQLLAKVIGSATDRTLRTLVRGARILDKWEGLRTLLNLAVAPRPDVRAAALGELRQWIATSNRRFTTAPPGTIQEIRTVLDAAQTAELGEIWRDLAAITDRA